MIFLMSKTVIIISLLALTIFSSNLPQARQKIEYPPLIADQFPNGEIPAVLLMRGKMNPSLQFDGVGQKPDPYDGCSDYKYESGNGHDFFFIEESRRCTISDKIHFAQQANAKSLVISHNEDDLSTIQETEQFPGILFGIK